MRFREYLTEHNFFTKDEVRAIAAEAFEKAMGRKPKDLEELQAWCTAPNTTNLRRGYGAMSPHDTARTSNNDGAPPIDGVSNRTYYK